MSQNKLLYIPNMHSLSLFSLLSLGWGGDENEWMNVVDGKRTVSLFCFSRMYSISTATIPRCLSTRVRLRSVLFEEKERERESTCIIFRVTLIVLALHSFGFFCGLSFIVGLRIKKSCRLPCLAFLWLAMTATRYCLFLSL